MKKINLIFYIAVGAIIAWLIISNALKHLPQTATNLVIDFQAATSKIIEPIDCPVSLNIPNGEQVECGYLIVPENRHNSDSRNIKVFWTRVAAYSQAKTAKPIVYLAGGPGEAGSEYLVKRMEQFFALRRDRDLIVIDQRGTGLSQPKLQCNIDILTDLLPSTLKACLEDYQKQKIDLSGYNTTQSAEDVKDLRQALNIDRWNLIGTSYGTRLAQETMRIDPDGIRSVVLNSTLPTFDSFFSPSLAADQKRVFEQMFADCTNDPQCDRAFPNLREVFLSIEGKMKGKVLKISSDKKTSTITFAEFISLLESQISHTATISGVPLLIWSMAESIEGNATASHLLVNFLAPQVKNVPEHREIKSIPVDKENQKAGGLNIAVICHEDWSFVEDLSKLERQISTYEPFARPQKLEPYKIACPMWNVGRANPSFKEKVISDIPTLLLIGNYDRLTAPVWTKEVAAGLSNSQVVRFRGTGHDVIDTNLCGLAISADFIANPEAALPLTCVGRMKPPKFLTKLIP